MDKFRNVSPKADGSLKSFTTLAENTDAQHADSKSKRHGSSQFHTAGVPPTSMCLCCNKRVLRAGQKRWEQTPSVIVDGSVKDDPNDLEETQASFVLSPGSI